MSTLKPNYSFIQSNSITIVPHNLDHYMPQVTLGQGFRDSLYIQGLLLTNFVPGGPTFAEGMLLSGIGSTGCCGAQHLVIPHQDSVQYSDEIYQKTRKFVYGWRGDKGLGYCRFTMGLLSALRLSNWKSISLITYSQNKYLKHMEEPKNEFFWAQKWLEQFFNVEVVELSPGLALLTLEPKKVEGRFTDMNYNASEVFDKGVTL